MKNIIYSNLFMKHEDNLRKALDKTPNEKTIQLRDYQDKRRKNLLKGHETEEIKEDKNHQEKLKRALDKEISETVDKEIRKALDDVFLKSKK